MLRASFTRTRVSTSTLAQVFKSSLSFSRHENTITPSSQIDNPQLACPKTLNSPNHTVLVFSMIAALLQC